MMMWAWIGAILIGISLGLLGSGGSILTVPVLIYWVGLDEKVAFASSLAIVGLISLFSALRYAKCNSVDWRTVVWFGLPGMVGAVLGAHLAGYLAAWLQLLIFAILLLIAAVLMFRPLKLTEDVRVARAFWQVALDGVLVGVITGLVGVGGGFLIIPALVLLSGLSMSMAVGSSLVIIAMNSISGFWEYLHLLDKLNLSLDWQLIALFTILGIAGSLVGHKLAKHLPQAALRKIFSVFLVFIGVFVLWHNLPKLMGVI